MKLRYCAGLLAALVLSTPASADSINPWGVWGDGAQMRKSKLPSSQFDFNAGPQKLGVPGKPVELAQGGARPSITPMAPETVTLDAGYAPGSVIIDTSGRKLYYMVSSTKALAYPVAVGKQGFAWTGTEKVSKIVDWPDWTPPEEMRQRKPFLPVKMTGGLNNPLGAKAIYLGNTLYRIHGTNDSNSIGTAASSGCFRMHNAHVVHLASLVSAGTPVYVLKSLPKTAKNQSI